MGQASSVDSFINSRKDDERVRICAKVAIVQCLLEAEERSRLVFVQQNWDFINPDMVRSSWLSQLLYILQEQIVLGVNVKDLFKNLCIINFNYDRCVEHFFYHPLQHLYSMSEHDAAELINAHLKIHHPYGQVGQLPWQVGSPEHVVPFGGWKDVAGNQLDTLYDRIRTFNERIEEGTVLAEMRHQMLIARRFVFLGFHFHPPNMELLRPIDGRAEHPRVEALATTIGRYPPERVIIEKQMRELVGPKNGKVDVVAPTDLDCTGLFAQFSTTLLT